ncbi:50S ribosomal protein L2 [archaeon]|jgi:large subunit ribosomal protein L2|nr:50S ribosomal protein L2 [archaeon]MBT3450726.1 50S ribosomal protein L2 [archaeon]MBT6869218.1 50S ribosomal protein L2 [archaeon]MBT7193754.1 50S ribosomal protein L2 [archaeon]MBT7381401.1 50S ribosomal protein L2 [archaeon]
MGKRIIQQRRGRGTGPYKSPSHRFKGEVKHFPYDSEGIVMDLINCPGHSAPLMAISYDCGEYGLSFAAHGIKVGDKINICKDSENAKVVAGNVLQLKDIPEGTSIYNIEARPGDGGKFVRSSGAFAKVVAKVGGKVRIKLPSKKEKEFLPGCRASIGVIAGAGRTEKPFLKAGKKYHKMRAKNKLYPKVCGVSMNAVDHPFGGGSSHVKGRPTQSPRNAPPGRKVGKIAPRRTGKKR